MFTFNRNEQIAILVLTALLLVGSVVSAYDYFWPGNIEDFHVHKNAIPVPDLADTATVPPPQQLRVGLNTATSKELTQLPHIGPKTADRIVAHREANGPFKRVDDLTAVKGIGPKTLEKSRNQVTLYAAP